jgi:prevent-host-death family protein
LHRVGARELKLRTGDVIARLRRGEPVMLTLRGEPLAVISPIDQTALAEGVDAEARRAEALGWLALSESAFSGWDNPDDDVWDRVEPG